MKDGSKTSGEKKTWKYLKGDRGIQREFGKRRRIKKTFRERQEDKSGKEGGAEGEIFKKRREAEQRDGRVKESPAET